MDFKTGDSIRVLIGDYTGKEGVVGVIATTKGADKSVGVRLFAVEKALPLTWFKPDELQKV